MSITITTTKMSLKFDNTAAFIKFKQQICENSAELRDFERRLQTAYNRQLLEAQLASKKVQSLKNAIEEKEHAAIENERKIQEELRLIAEIKCKRGQEEKAAFILQNQIQARKQQELEEYTITYMERLVLDEEIEAERKRELNSTKEMQEAKIRLRNEQLKVLELKNMRMLEEQREEAERECKLKEDATRLANFDSTIVVARHRRIQEFQDIKDKLLNQLIELDRLKQEKEELSLRLQCIEKEEIDRQKFQDEKQALIRQKEERRCTYEEVTRDRRLELVRVKEEDAIYANNIKELLRKESEREMTAKKETKRIRTAVRYDNLNLQQYRKQRREEEMREERAKAEEDMAEQERERKIVCEERLRLLRLIGEDMWKFLPPGTITEEDLLCLNADKLQLV